MNLKHLIELELESVLQKIKSNLCEIDKETATEILSVISHEPLSKAESYDFLNISRSKFDSLIRDRKLPPGMKRIGFKELVWYKDDLLKYINLI